MFSGGRTLYSKYTRELWGRLQDFTVQPLLVAVYGDTPSPVLVVEVPVVTAGVTS